MPRRRRTAGLAAAVVVVVLVVAIALLDRTDDTTPAAPSPTTTWNQQHRVDLPAGWSVTQRNVSPTDESTSLSGPDDKGCLVATFPAKPAPSWWPQSPTQVTVQGHQGSYGSLDPDYGPYPRAVLWPDDSQRWVHVSCDLDRAGIVEMAEQVRLEPNPMAVPFRLAALPDSLTLTALIESERDGEHASAVLFEMASESRPLVMQISNLTASTAYVSEGPAERGTISGRPVEIRTGTQTICFPTRSQPVCISGPGDEPATDWAPAARAVAERTAELLTPVEDPGDDTSWIDADVALPR